MEQRICPRCGTAATHPESRYCDACRCQVPGCTEPIHARHLCTAHYQRQQTQGDVRADIPIPSRSQAICTVDGCEAIVLARGWCRKHYQRWQRSGDPTKLGRSRSRDETARIIAEENATGLRTCSECLEAKPLGEFVVSPRSRNGRTRRCKQCIAAAGKRIYEDRKKRDLEGLRRRTRVAYQRRMYGVDQATVDALAKAQKGRCAACRAKVPKLVIDHDHTSGIVRELLCNHCNLALGLAGDSIERLQQLTAYLWKHKTRLF